MRRPSHLAPLLVVVGVGFLFVSAASLAPPERPRQPRKISLVDLIREEDARTRALRARLDSLAAELDALRRRSEGREGTIAALRSRIDRLSTAAGLTPVSGPGLIVELKDSSLDRSPTGDPNDLVIHEEDLQAVVNGLWAVGAEAIAINGERITAASAIRCVGNTLLLHGSVYSPPYRIAAIGSPARMRGGFGRDPLVERVRLLAQEFKLGFTVTEQALLQLPAFRGIVVSRFAERAR